MSRAVIIKLRTFNQLALDLFPVDAIICGSNFLDVLFMQCEICNTAAIITRRKFEVHVLIFRKHTPYTTSAFIQYLIDQHPFYNMQCVV